MSFENLPRVLTIAGSDCSGGAGIQADLKTIQALGCYGMSAITVLTAQNTLGVKSVYSSTPAFLEDQIAAIFEDIRVDAVKVGMLYSTALIETVAKCLRKYQPSNIVVDPVMVAKGGFRLLKGDAVAALQELMIPLSNVLTPNLLEAELLAGHSITTESDMENAAEFLLPRCGNAILLKGGHLNFNDRSPDLLVMKGEKPIWIVNPRIATMNTHGTGCTYSSAIAAELAKGVELKLAVRRARDYLQAAIQSGARFKLGKGQGPVDHNWQSRSQT